MGMGGLVGWVGWEVVGLGFWLGCIGGSRSWVVGYLVRLVLGLMVGKLGS